MKSHFASYSILIGLSFLFSACSFREAIIDTHTGKVIGGYRKGDYILNKTNSSDVKNLDSLRQKGLRLKFDINTKKLQTIEVYGTDEFRTRKGIKMGDPLAEVEQIYGPPARRFLTVTAGNDVIGKIDGYYYEDMIFFPDSSQVKVAGFLIGNWHSN